jgi:hypothetical protein
MKVAHLDGRLGDAQSIVASATRCRDRGLCVSKTLLTQTSSMLLWNFRPNGELATFLFKKPGKLLP